MQLLHRHFLPVEQHCFIWTRAGADSAKERGDVQGAMLGSRTLLH